MPHLRLHDLRHNYASFLINSGRSLYDVQNILGHSEQQVPELETSVFLVPGSAVKNGDDRLIVLNDVALSVVNDLRGKHPTHVFTFRKKPIDHMSNSGWRRAREKAGLKQVRVHDLKHTFGRRLRAASVTTNYKP